MMAKMLSREVIVVYLLASAVMTVLDGAAASGQEETPSAPSEVEQAAGAGRWESARDDAGKRDVQIQIERFDDSSIAGSISVVGSAYLNKARLEGRVDGKEVYCVLVGADDQQIGTFAGTVADTGLSGTYTTNQGDSGSWNWAAPAAAEVLKENTGIGEAAAP